VRVAALILVLALPAAAEDNSGLDQLDTRDDLRGFEAVGRVDIADGGFCTGTLIAPDLVLTAAHCVIEDDGSPVDARRITFRAGLSNGIALAEVPVAATVFDPDYQRISPSPMNMIRIDVALLHLAHQIPTSDIAPFSVASADADDEVSVVSYAEGRQETLSWQRVCKVVAREGDLIAFDCDVTYGASGAPVLDRSGGYRARIVSIVSAGSTFQDRPVALGMDLPPVVARLKQALRSGKVISSAPPVADDASQVGKRIILGGSTDTGARFVKP
jgi:protease YdgD